jgi:hypothetical protein
MPATALNTPYAVLSFPQIFSPKPRAEGGDPVFSCSLLFAVAEQKSPAFKAMQDAVLSLAKEKFPSVPVKSLMLPFRDAGEKAYSGYEPGMLYISPWSKYKPGVVDVRLQDVLDPAEVWAGQKVRANVLPFAWTNTGKRGISFGLNHIQIIDKTAPRIDGRAAANKVFDAVETDEEDSESPF